MFFKVSGILRGVHGLRRSHGVSWGSGRLQGVPGMFHGFSGNFRGFQGGFRGFQENSEAIQVVFRTILMDNSEGIRSVSNGVLLGFRVAPGVSMGLSVTDADSDTDAA